MSVIYLRCASANACSMRILNAGVWRARATHAPLVSCLASGIANCCVCGDSCMCAVAALVQPHLWCINGAATSLDDICSTCYGFYVCYCCMVAYSLRCRYETKSALNPLRPGSMCNSYLLVFSKCPWRSFVCVCVCVYVCVSNFCLS